MSKEKSNVGARFLLFGFAFIIGAIIVAPVQIYFWDIWNEGVRVELDADQSMCLRRISYLQQERDTGELVNLERAGEDQLVFSLGTKCERVINNYDFEYRRRMKGSMYLRAIWWMTIFVIAVLIASLVDLDDDESSSNYY